MLKSNIVISISFLNMEFSAATQLQTFLSIFKREESKILKGIIARYLIFSLNFPLEESKARKDAITELKQKKMNPCYLDSFFNRKIVLKKEPQRSMNRNKDTIKFQCGHLSFYLSLSKYQSIKERMDDNQIFEVMFRYHFMWGSPFLWSIDEHIHEILVDRFNVTLECFASPFDRKMDRYLSLFQEDKACGSLGNFFSYPFQEDERCLVNPPFMSSLFEKMIPILKKGTFFVFLPLWDDDKYVQEIRRMGCSEVKFEKGTYRFFTLENDIISKIDIVLVCISSENIDLHVAF
jgi:hypothetical protein